MTDGDVGVATASGGAAGKVPGNDVLIAEYAAAQNSAQHHELLGWQSRSILWTASMLLFGPAAARGLEPVVVSLLAFAGLCLLISPLIWNEHLGQIKNLKYERCRAIEAVLGMQQHISTKDRFPERYLASASYVLVGLLAAAWIVRAVLAWCH